MMRWHTAVGLLALALFMVCGCSQNYFLSQTEYENFHKLNDLPRNLEGDPHVIDAPPVGYSEPPATVNHLDLKPRYISLQECIALALQQGMIGSQSVRFPGVTEDLVSFGGPGVGVVGSDAIRVLSLNNAIIGSNIDRELARFDAQWTTSMTWTNTDELVQGLGSFSNGMTGSLISTIAKPLPTGGAAGITFENDYRLLARPPVGTFGVLNPSYTSKVTFAFEQPLLRYYGIDLNQVLPAFGGSTLFTQLNGRRATGEGILIARVRFDQQRADFERAVHFQLLNVEAAYWNLYGAYVTLYSTEQAMRMAHITWKIGLEQQRVGRTGREILAGLRAQFEQFRATRVSNLGSVLENERLLRILLGLKVGGDNERLVPCDAPTLAPYLPDWSAALQDLLNLRPEIIMARQDLRTKQFNLMAQATLLKPDLRFQGSYTPVGTGLNLAGNGVFVDGTGTLRTANALRALSSDHFNDWSMGLVMNVPLGYRFEHGQVRQAKLQLAQAFALLKEQEIKGQNQLAKIYRQLQEFHRVYEVRRQERQAWAERLQVYYDQYRYGRITLADVNLFDAERQWTTALTNEYAAIVSYNIALAQFEFAKGTIMQYDNVTLAEGAIPICAVSPAREHERERSHAIVLRERESAQSRLQSHPPTGISNLPITPSIDVPSLPALEQAAAMIQDPTGLTTAAGKPVLAPPTSAAMAAGPSLPLELGELTGTTRLASVSAPVQAPPAPFAPPPEPPARLDVAVPEDPEVRRASQASPVRLGVPVVGPAYLPEFTPPQR
jgi:outer membrane protein TolC